MTTQGLLTPENYTQGFLIDEELMGGITEHPEQKEHFLAFVLRHTTGEYLGYTAFENLGEALQAINGVQRSWTYEKTKNCSGNGNCGGGGSGCGGGGGCHKNESPHTHS